MSFFLVEKLSITVQTFSKWGVLKWQPPYTNGKFAQYHQNVDFARLTSVNSTSINVPAFVILGHKITQCTVLESRCKTGVKWLNLLTGCSPYDAALSASLCTSKFQASSVLDSSLNQPHMAKIGGTKGWCPSAANAGIEFIQIDFTLPFRVCAVDTQGHHSRFVSSYQVAYSLDGSTWLSVTLENKTDLVGARHTV